MLSQRELENAIRECEQGNGSYQNCEKLATLYTLYDHLFAEPEPRAVRPDEVVIGDYGMSDFLSMIQGKKAEDVWAVMDELMSALQVTNPRLYNGVLRKIAD